MPFDCPRHDWSPDEIEAIFMQPLDALFDAVGFEAARHEVMETGTKRTLIDAR